MTMSKRVTPEKLIEALQVVVRDAEAADGDRRADRREDPTG
jgi:hypothetical protein